jgi:hypothetical protein
MKSPEKFICFGCGFGNNLLLVIFPTMVIMKLHLELPTAWIQKHSSEYNYDLEKNLDSKFIEIQSKM